MRVLDIDSINSHDLVLLHYLALDALSQYFMHDLIVVLIENEFLFEKHPCR
jgi:hypothetical protein